MTGDDIPSSASGRARSWRDGADDAEEFRDSLGKELATQVACSPGGGWLGGKLLRAAKGKLDDLLCKTKGLFKRKTPNLSLGKLPKDSPLTEEEWAKIDAVFHGPKGSLSNRAQVYNILVQALMDRGYTAEEIIELLNQGLK